MSRRQIIPRILDKPKSLTTLAREMGMHPRDVENDLKHLLLSIRHSEYVADIYPADCRKCGFEFSTDKLHKPSKCPKCKATWISEPLIGLKLKVRKSLHRPHPADLSKKAEQALSARMRTE